MAGPWLLELPIPVPEWCQGTYWSLVSLLRLQVSTIKTRHRASALVVIACFIWTSPQYADTLDCLVSFSFLSPSMKPMYDTIWSCLAVQYDPALSHCTIRSGLVPVYDVIWLSFHV